ncbi:hypothetical protein SEA_MUFASA8_87 [Arthrobacter phage Mufasa8]|uniref:Uncharacterized protein n=1 Tax=Arthrobacter phage Mufasa8 TaxID=2656526 RepID=A0A649VN80_9CAUD|nr:hypothetical protein HYQ08_gp087 [Arthrobacter phage Mufasa8]QGJ93535.1 hypothetical protein SEA_MUFASA8_87 [Arthrobacter phage Mufasa8]
MTAETTIPTRTDVQETTAWLSSSASPEAVECTRDRLAASLLIWVGRKYGHDVAKRAEAHIKHIEEPGVGMPGYTRHRAVVTVTSRLDAQ